LVFDSLQEKRAFRTLRRIQSKYGRGHTAFSSRIGQTVYVRSLEEIIDGNKVIIVKRFKPLLCDECGSHVKYDKHAMQVCSNCGLVANDNFAIIEHHEFPSFENLNWNDRLRCIPLAADVYYDDSEIEYLAGY